MHFKRELFTYLDFIIYFTIVNLISIPKYKDLALFLVFVFYRFKICVKKGEWELLELHSVLRIVYILDSNRAVYSNLKLIE